MSSKALSDEEAEQLSAWPPEVAHSDLVAHFTFSVEDRRWLRSHRGAAERIGLAVQLCGLAYLGFVPADLAGTPRKVVLFVAEQIGVAPAGFARYGREVDGRTRRRHVAAVVEQAGWRVCGPGEWKALGDWLKARALEHDTPSVLFRQALQQLRADRVVRPAWTASCGRCPLPGSPPKTRSAGAWTRSCPLSAATSSTTWWPPTPNWAWPPWCG